MSPELLQLLGKVSCIPRGDKLPVSRFARELNASTAVVFDMLALLVETGWLDRTTLRRRVYRSRQWTAAQDAIVRERFPIGGAKACEPLLLDRSYDAISQRACKLGITWQALVPWTEDDDAVIRAHYARDGVAVCSEKLPERTYGAIKGRAAKLGIVGRRGRRPGAAQQQPRVHASEAIGPVLPVYSPAPGEVREGGAAGGSIKSAAPKPQLSFEEQLRRVENGEAKIAPVVRIPSRAAIDRTYGGVSTAYEGPA